MLRPERHLVVRSEQRFVTRSVGIETRHSFSFGAHYDPLNVSFGRLLAFNDERLEPGAGFATHRHSGIRIVTYVVAGELVHGGATPLLLGAGALAHTDATAGVEHSESNASDEKPLRFLQSWLTPGPDEPGPLAVRLAPAQAFCLPRKDFVHVFVVEGTGHVDGLGSVEDGDVLRAREPDGLCVVAGPRGAHLYVWAF